MYRVGIAAGTILAFALWFAWFAENNTEITVNDDAPPEVDSSTTEHLEHPLEAAAEVTTDGANREGLHESSDTADLFGRISPAEVEGAVYQRLAEQSGLTLTSLEAVKCDQRTCRVVFSGLEGNPQYIDEYGEVLSTLTNPPWVGYQPTSGSIGTREISPGAREYVVGFTYVALVDASDDREIAARQQAACAGAWARVTEQRGSDDYLRGAQERSAEWLQMSAAVLGLEEAQRLADELRYGPLTRDCHATPY